MVLSQYGYDQCVPTIVGLNRVEVSDQDLRVWKKLEEIQIKWSQTLSLQSGTFFNHSPQKLISSGTLKEAKSLCLCNSRERGRSQ
ncbi:hypothetical protein Golax_024214, partial [Gossypium laxum]|nr:hypothetical protein [Gossypium laxum]